MFALARDRVTGGERGARGSVSRGRLWWGAARDRLCAGRDRLAMGLLGVLLAGACFLPASTAGWAERSQAATVLTTTHAVHSLMPEQAREGRPVHLRVVLTYYDPYIDTRHGALFVHDATGSVFIPVPPALT